jgi:hypothetical protein
MMDEHPVFTCSGDAVDEVRALVAQLAATHGSEAAAGLHRLLYVSRAGMTVVMVTELQAPLARELRARSGWTEPRP